MFVAPSGKTNNRASWVTASRELSTRFVTSASQPGRLSTSFPRSSRSTHRRTKARADAGGAIWPLTARSRPRILRARRHGSSHPTRRHRDRRDHERVRLGSGPRIAIGLVPAARRVLHRVRDVDLSRVRRALGSGRQPRHRRLVGRDAIARRGGRCPGRGGGRSARGVDHGPPRGGPASCDGCGRLAAGRR